MPQDPGLPISIPTAELSAFCGRNRIRRLSLFGSVLRDDFTPQSDIDVLVDFEPGTQLTLFGLARVENELSDLLDRRVDLHEPGSLHPVIREGVLGSAKDVYVAA